MTVAKETLIFLMSLVLGGIIGVVYDVFRIIRIACPLNKTWVFLEDVCFVFVASALTFLFSVSYLNGYLRAFVVFGELSGFAIYYLTIGVLVINCAKVIIYWIKIVIKGIYRIFLSPTFKFFRYICTKISLIFKHISQSFLSCRFGKKFHLKE